MNRYLKILYSLNIILYSFLILPKSICAAPILAIDNTDVNIGTIREGDHKEVKYTFHIKNKGDEPLKIKYVKPG